MKSKAVDVNERTSVISRFFFGLMDTSNARCHNRSKGPTLWSKYVKGISILFSLYASGAGTITVVTILSPLQLAGLRPGSTFLSLEEPILKGKLVGLHDGKMKFVYRGTSSG